MRHAPQLTTMQGPRGALDNPESRRTMMQVSDSSRVLCAGSRKAPSSREGVSSSATAASPRHSGGARSPARTNDSHTSA